MLLSSVILISISDAVMASLLQRAPCPPGEIPCPTPGQPGPPPCCPKTVGKLCTATITTTTTGHDCATFSSLNCAAPSSLTTFCPTYTCDGCNQGGGFTATDCCVCGSTSGIPCSTTGVPDVAGCGGGIITTATITTTTTTPAPCR